ncbi:hypothetical protein [Streptomyces sp. NPDC004100]
MERIAQIYTLGMDVAAPQIGIDRAIAVVQPAQPGQRGSPCSTPVSPMFPRRPTSTTKLPVLLSLTCTASSPAPGTSPSNGNTATKVYERDLACLVQDEIDYLDARLYTACMRPDLTPIPVQACRQTGCAWAYGS